MKPVSMTVSGLQAPVALMGGAPRMMSAGVDWAPVLPIRQNAATCWYHANTPNRMAPHVYNGLAGMWLIEDDLSKQLPLPKHYGVDDFPLIIQDKRLDNFATPVYDPPADGGFLGDTLLVNGVRNPFIEVSRGWMRLVVALPPPMPDVTNSASVITGRLRSSPAIRAFYRRR